MKDCGLRFKGDEKRKSQDKKRQQKGLIDEKDSRLETHWTFYRGEGA